MHHRRWRATDVSWHPEESPVGDHRSLTDTNLPHRPRSRAAACGDSILSTTVSRNGLLRSGLQCRRGAAVSTVNHCLSKRIVAKAECAKRAIALEELTHIRAASGVYRRYGCVERRSRPLCRPSERLSRLSGARALRERVLRNTGVLCLHILRVRCPGRHDCGWHYGRSDRRKPAIRIGSRLVCRVRAKPLTLGARSLMSDMAP